MHFLLEALLELRRSHSELLDGWQLDVVGYGQPDYLARMQEYVCKNKLSNLVVFHGVAEGDSKFDYYNQAAFFILPSLSEGQPIAPLEALGCGKPVLLTENCNLPEAFEYGCALRIRPEPHSIANGIRRMLTMPEEEYIAMQKQGLDMTTKLFAWERCSKRMEEVYRLLLQGEKASERSKLFQGTKKSHA